jgi:hypothetical protein
MSDTPISDSTPHNVAELGMLCRRLERELNAANDRIKRLEDARTVAAANSLANMISYENAITKIKRLEDAGDGLLTAMRDDWSEYVDWIDETTDAIGKWNKAKEAKL